MSHIGIFEKTTVRPRGYAALFAVMLCFTVTGVNTLRGYAAALNRRTRPGRSETTLAECRLPSLDKEGWQADAFCRADGVV